MQVEKIHDVRKHLASDNVDPTSPHSRKTVGVINFKLIRVMAYAVISIALLACAICCLVAVWGYVDPNVAWRALASLGIISTATAVFVALNEGFGSAIRR